MGNREGMNRREWEIERRDVMGLGYVQWTGGEWPMELELEMKDTRTFEKNKEFILPRTCSGECNTRGGRGSGLHFLYGPFRLNCIEFITLLETFISGLLYSNLIDK